jgi:two-component system, NtrC family, response regulator AtoC
MARFGRREPAVARILAIEDEANLRFAIRQALKKVGHEVAEADSVGAAWDLARQSEFDLVLTDINLGGDSGVDLVGKLRDDGYDGVVVVMTGYGTVESAVRAMKLGADDYLQKPLSLEELVLLVERLLEARKVRRRLKVYERLDNTRAGERAIIGKSKAWSQAQGVAERLAAMPIPPTRAGGKGVGGALPTILLLGETGTGKGVLARHIHETAQKLAQAGSGGATGPFVHINCSALPPTLVESELFGHERGAFTDAKEAREGLIEMAEGGTIFLDEIGDMPLELQAKLLTVVEEGVFRRLGSSKDRYVRARIIAATNQDLKKRSDDGKFRRDLYYRLNAFTIKIPALREREEDAALLAADMLARFGRLYGRPGLTLGDAARAAIARHDWPGNVRELINVIQHAAMLGESAEVGPADLGLAPAGRLVATNLLARHGASSTNGVNGNGNGHSAGGVGGGALEPTDGTGTLVFDFDQGVHKADEVERELIIQALRRTRGNVSKAAKLIGMQRSSFRYRIERLSLEPYVQEIARQ